MAFEHGIIGSTLKILVLSVVVFFLLYFLFPGASEQFFGTSIKDTQVARASESVLTALEETDLSAEDLQKAKKALEDPRVKQAFISAKEVSSETISSVTAFIKDNYL